jgi:hypothetical protein
LVITGQVDFGLRSVAFFEYFMGTSYASTTFTSTLIWQGILKSEKEVSFKMKDFWTTVCQSQAFWPCVSRELSQKFTC